MSVTVLCVHENRENARFHAETLEAGGMRFCVPTMGVDLRSCAFQATGLCDHGFSPAAPGWIRSARRNA